MRPFGLRGRKFRTRSWLLVGFKRKGNRLFKLVILQPADVRLRQVVLLLCLSLGLSISAYLSALALVHGLLSLREQLGSFSLPPGLFGDVLLVEGMI